MRKGDVPHIVYKESYLDSYVWIWTWFNIYIVIQTLHHSWFYIHWQLMQCWSAKWSLDTALPAAALDNATPYHFLNLSQSQCLPYCINCPLHLHFHPSLTGHVSVLDWVQHQHPALFSLLITGLFGLLVIRLTSRLSFDRTVVVVPPPHPWQCERGSPQCRASYRISNMVTVVK